MPRFLSIDDDEIFNFLNQRILELSGTLGKLQSFTSARKALDFLNENTAHPDQWPEIILLDIRMPGMDGFEFLDQFQQLPAALMKKVKVFMLTSSIDERDRSRATTYPCVLGYYSKPLSEAVFKKMVDTPLTTSLTDSL